MKKGKQEQQDYKIKPALKKTDDLPPRYTSNNLKEELALENFDKKYKRLYPDKPPVLLFPLNEYGVEKLICTTIRPTQMPYRGLYDIRETAVFLADFLAYEPLENPVRYPEYLPSPEIVLKWRRGSGVDAYCVCGIAPKYITEKNLLKQTCPLLQTEEVLKEEKKEEEDPDRPYQIPKKRYENSLFQLEKQKEQEEEERRKKIYDENESDEEYPEEEEDLLAGKRVHCWVMVQAGKRSVEKHIFIEPSTGFIYDIDKSPYEKMLFCWNNENVWVNVMQDEIPLNSTGINLRNRDIWENVFYEPDISELKAAIKTKDEVDDEDELNLGSTAATTASTGTAGGNASGGNGSGNGDNNNSNNNGAGNGGGSGTTGGSGSGSSGGGISGSGTGTINLQNAKDTDYSEGKKPEYLDVPKSWVEGFVIDRDDYEKQFAGNDKPGENTVLYEKSKLERFGLLCNNQGLIWRVTEYKDLARVYPKKITEEYKNRQDRLLKRIKLCDNYKVIEYFGPGRNCQEKEIYDIAGVEREVKFYTIARLDGLSSRKELINHKLIETYENTPDRIFYRSVTIDLSLRGTSHVTSLPLYDGSECAIVKMKEKYLKDENKEGDQISTIAYVFQPKEESRIEVKYHYLPNRITAKTIVFYNDGTPPEISEIDPGFVRPSDGTLNLLLKDLKEREKNCLIAMREGQREAMEILQQRNDEENNVVVEKDIYILAREKNLSSLKKEKKDDDEEEDNENNNDYLTPFLSGITDISQITFKQAQNIREQCLKALRDRLIERSAIIQRRLDDENAALAKKQAQFQRNRDHVDGAEEEFEQFCQEAMFRIKILEQRRQRHEETALIKYKALSEKLARDPRLAILYKNK